MRILAGIDLRTTDHELLVRRAGRFAAAIGGKLDLLFVTGREEALYRRHLDDLLRDNVSEEARGQAVCPPGNPVEVLIAFSETYDVVVVGPRAGPLERLILGTVAGRVIRRARSAVLVPRLIERKLKGKAKLLVGVDLSGADPHWLLGEAAAWGARISGQIDMVYADPSGLSYIPSPTFMRAARKDWEQQRAPEIAHLRELMERIPEENRGEALLGGGGPDNVLVEMSGEYDLVLVGTREREGLAGYILGSVADHVVRNSRCDVLTLPSATVGAEARVMRVFEKMEEAPSPDDG